MKKAVYAFLIILLLLLVTGCKHEHNFTSETFYPTCTENGYTKFSCECGYTYNDYEVDALGHEFSEWTIINKATDESTGLQERICSVCDMKDTEVIPMLEHVHNYTKNKVKPTCTTQGYTEYTCKCGDTYTDSYVDVIEHEYGKFVVDKKPTYEEEGEKSRHCEVCDHRSEITSIPVLNKLQSETITPIMYVSIPTTIQLSFTYLGEKIDNSELEITIQNKIKITGDTFKITEYYSSEYIYNLKVQHKQDSEAYCEFTIISCPDLGGYPIRIAVDASDLKNFDPFLDTYTADDKEAKQKAITEVQELFNCSIEFAAYPSYATVGASRWNYIMNQAALGLSDYDFLYVPTNKLRIFEHNGIMISLDDYYLLYGKSYMTEEQETNTKVEGLMKALFPNQTEKFNVFIMPIGCSYYMYSSDCQSHTIYFAFVETILRTIKYMEE